MAFLPLTIVNFIAALFLPRLTEKIGNARVMLVGQIILLFGLILSALTDPNTGYLLAIGLPMILIGLGQGWLLAPLTSAGLEAVKPEMAGAASGLTNTMHQLGGPVGLSVVVLFTSGIAGNLTTYYHAVMWFVVGFMVLGLAVGLFGMGKRADKNK
jgi:MFS family permease